MPQNKQSSTCEIYRKYPSTESLRGKKGVEKEKRFNLFFFCKSKKLSLAKREGEMFTFHIIHQKIFKHKREKKFTALRRSIKSEKKFSLFSTRSQLFFLLNRHFCHFTSGVFFFFGGNNNFFSYFLR